MTMVRANTFKLATGLCLAMSGVVGPALAQTKTVMIDGSSTVFPIMEAVAEEFQKSKRSAVRVTVGISGTGGGFKKFCRGETDISNGSRPILKAEMDDCKKAGIEFYELPIAFDALTVAVSPKNTFIGECITVVDLKKIWEPAAQGKVMSWSDVREGFPKQPIRLYGAGSDSGTFDYFTEAVTGKAKASRGDYTASEDDNVLVQGIENDANALGYIPFSYYAPQAAKMKALAIDWGKGEGCVKPTLENVLAGKYNPMSRPLFVYVSKKAAEAKPEVREFVEFTMLNAVPLIKEVKYLQLPDSAYVLGLKKFKEGKTGTIFGGVPEVGLKIEDILSRESKS